MIGSSNQTFSLDFKSWSELSHFIFDGSKTEFKKMNEIENLLDSMRIAIDNEKFYQSENFLAMQEQIKSLEEKNKRLSMEIEKLTKEKNLHQKQFIDCHNRLNESNDLVRKLENSMNPEHTKGIEKIDDEVSVDLELLNQLDGLTTEECINHYQFDDSSLTSEELSDPGYHIENKGNGEWSVGNKIPLFISCALENNEYLSYVFKIPTFFAYSLFLYL